MVTAGMPSSAARPGTGHSPGPRLGSTAGRPLGRPRIPRWAVMVLTRPSLDRRGRLGGREPPALRASARCRGLRAAAAGSGGRAGVVSRGGRVGGGGFPGGFRRRGEERVLGLGELVLGGGAAGGVAGALKPLAP